MFELQKRICVAVGKTRRTGLDKLKALGNDLLFDMISYTCEEYTAHLGDKESPGNMFYSPNILKKLPFGNEKL